MNTIKKSPKQELGCYTSLDQIHSQLTGCHDNIMKRIKRMKYLALRLTLMQDTQKQIPEYMTIQDIQVITL